MNWVITELSSPEALGVSEMILKLGLPSASASCRVKAFRHLSQHKIAGV